MQATLKQTKVAPWGGICRMVKVKLRESLLAGSLSCLNMGPGSAKTKVRRFRVHQHYVWFGSKGRVPHTKKSKIVTSAIYGHSVAIVNAPRGRLCTRPGGWEKHSSRPERQALTPE